MANVVLVTGVSGVLGGLMARTLSNDPQLERVIGVDAVPPLHDMGRAQFVRADIRNPMIGKILSQERVDTVLHLGVLATSRQAGSRSSQKEINVIGTMQLLAACQKADTLERLVAKSSSTVYGSSPRDPAMFTEEMTAKRGALGGLGKDSVDIETYIRGFARRSPGVDVCMLRTASIIGPGLRTALSDYFSLPALPVPLGFDGRFQLLGLVDAAAALRLAVHGQVTGIVNVAGDGMLTIRQAARLARLRTIPVVAQSAPLVQQTARYLGWGQFDAEQMDFLCFGRGIDTTRMRVDLGLEPTMTTREVFEDAFRNGPARGLLDAVTGGSRA
ncbi:NAD-dependent epimerase/dehydratase family protein [Leekyejoonella antrihumi]|uniref:NAD-dependent epimerase/dehydratase family protein n=1 Tax=Leekyejoonella antrihumi TaxID=1660198 RepID=A0A563DXK4_9MICO|nr:NAD-dependent epimerase/dehydratase family protein [Leekyejoonella antrihumi]TWP34711.1 NAD-dependent epimerase/dehydratase family protein [Leekyejoonella antrihumi]